MRVGGVKGGWQGLALWVGDRGVGCLPGVYIFVDTVWNA